jgi:hypothetical protein
MSTKNEHKQKIFPPQLLPKLRGEGVSVKRGDVGEKVCVRIEQL